MGYFSKYLKEYGIPGTPILGLNVIRSDPYLIIKKRKKNMTTIRADPDQAGRFVGPDLGPSCLQKLPTDDTSR